MHRLKMRPLILIAGLIGLAAIVFGLVNTTYHAQATTNDNGWKLVGPITKIKNSVGDTVMDVSIAASPKTAPLVKGAFVIVKSNPPDPAKDYPKIFRVIAYKAPILTLEQVQGLNCNPAAGPLVAVPPATQNLYTGVCNKPVVGGTNETDLSGISDIVVDAGQPATTDFYHCIARTDIAAGGADVKTGAVCFDNSGVLGQGTVAEPINSPPGEGTTGDAGGIGPPPPPPYSVAPPAKGRGTYTSDNLVTTTCFPDVGKSINIISTVTILGAHAQLVATGKTVGFVDIYTNQSNANCDALTPTGTPGNLGLTVYPATDIAACPSGNCVQSPYRLNGNVLHGYPDWDMDGCTDANELWQDKPGAITKCGDDPWNPNDVPAGATPDVSGEYSLTAIAVRQDCNPALTGVPTICEPPGVGQAMSPDFVAGFYYNCDADINQAGKNLTARVLCYIDSPAVTTNPAAVPSPNTGATTCPPAPAQYCGDGVSGAPPPGTTVGTYPTNPRLFAVIKTKHTVLTGTVDNTQNVIKLQGCFNAPKPSFLGNVYVKAIVNIHTGHGSVQLWTGLPSEADCKGATPTLVGPGGIIALHITRQNMKVADPFPAPGASTGHDGDGDGCSDKRELTDTANRGGLRDPSNHYDYFNPTQDGLNRVDDILATVNQYFQDDPPGAPDMKSLTDRTAILNSNAWNLGPPNGQQRVDDILNSVKQYFHDC
jgi:hypothetical protein